jgi:hypothetical protein
MAGGLISTQVKRRGRHLSMQRSTFLGSAGFQRSGAQLDHTDPRDAPFNICRSPEGSPSTPAHPRSSVRVTFCRVRPHRVRVRSR